MKDKLYKRIVAVIPAYDPGISVCEVIKEVSDRVDHVIVVNDGCCEEDTRRLEESAALHQCTLIVNDGNKGKGFSLIEGIRRALEDFDTDFVITVDSDGQHAPQDIANFKDAVEGVDPETRCLVLGERNYSKSMPFRSKFGNIFSSLFFGNIFYIRIQDTQTGYRMMSRRFAELFCGYVQSGRYETEMCMLIYALITRSRIVEVAVKTIYEGNNEISKYRPFVDSMRVMGPMVGYVAVGIASFIFDYIVFMMLLKFVGLHYIGAHAGARVCSGIFNFLANKFITFSSKEALWPEFRKYILLVIISFIVSSLILIGLMSTGVLSEAVSKPIAEVIVFLLNFVFLRSFVFAKKMELVKPHTS